jgi:hypothetical protein
MRGEDDERRGGGLETLSLSLIFAPLSRSRRRETIESWPPVQATWRGVEPPYREEDERRGG